MRVPAVRVRAALVAAAVVGGALALPATAAPSAPFTVTKQFVNVASGPGSGETIRLETSIYKPASASARRPVPVILMTHGWGGRHDKGNELKASEFFAKSGYAVVAWDSRGFGDSEGWVQLNSPDYEVQDARKMLDLAASLPYVLKDGPSDPRAGMFGYSYAGGIQLLTAAFDPRLDAIVPIITWNDLSRSLAPNAVVKAGWVSLLFAAGTVSGLVGDNPPNEGSHPPDGTVDPVLADQFANAVATGQFSAGALQALDYRSPARYIDRIKTPTLLIQGQGDTLFNWNEALATHTSLRARGVPTKLVQAQIGHGVPAAPGEQSFSGGRDDVIGRSALAWYAKHLRRQAVDTGPAVLVRRDWGNTGDGKDGFQAFSPVSFDRLGKARLSLDAGTASLTGARPAGGVARILATGAVPTSYSEIANFSSPGNHGDKSPTDAPGTATSFTTAPLTSPLTVIGVPHVTLSVTSTAPDTTLFLKLQDVAPNGTVTQVRRIVVPVRVQTNPTGVPARVEVDIPGFAHRWEKGHSLRLVIASSDLMYFGSRQPAVYEIRTGGAAGSLLTLPIER